MSFLFRSPRSEFTNEVDAALDAASVEKYDLEADATHLEATDVPAKSQRMDQTIPRKTS